MKILIPGSSGLLGSECKLVLSKDHEIIAPTKNEMDIISWDGVVETFQKTNPDIVINCAAFTDIEACETEPFLVQKINIEGPRNLAQCSARYQSRFIHISSDFVFDGQKLIPQPYFEDDPPNPLSAYAVSKMESEKAVRHNVPFYSIVRTGWLYGINGRCFVKSIVKRAIERSGDIYVADDQFGSPTWARRLAYQIKDLINPDARGIYHTTAEGYCSRFEYAEYIIKKLSLTAVIRPISMKSLNKKAVRPLNCLLENRVLKNQGICIMRNWKDDLDTFLEKYGDTIIKGIEAAIEV